MKYNSVTHLKPCLRTMVKTTGKTRDFAKDGQGRRKYGLGSYEKKILKEKLKSVVGKSFDLSTIDADFPEVTGY